MFTPPFYRPLNGFLMILFLFGGGVVSTVEAQVEPVRSGSERSRQGVSPSSQDTPPAGNPRAPRSTLRGSGEEEEADTSSFWQVLRSPDVEDEGKVRKRLSCKTCRFDERGLPKIVFTKRLGGPGEKIQELDVDIEGTEFEALDQEERKALGGLADSLPSGFRPQKRIVHSRKSPYLKLSFIPLVRRGGGKVEKLVDHEVVVKDVLRGSSGERGGEKSFAANSVLRNGDWYRLGVTESGIYEIDRAKLVEMGIDADSIAPADLNLYGNGAGMLPFQNDEPRPDDLKKNRILVQDGGDGSFDDGDRILFYARGPHVWEQNSLTGRFSQRRHLFSDSSFYFLRVGGGSPKRIQQEPEVTDPADGVVESFHERAAHENDRVNLIQSGRKWAGEEFQDGEERSFSFPMSQLIPGSRVRTQAVFLARTLGTNNQSFFEVTVNDASSNTLGIDGVSGHYESNQGYYRSTTVVHDVGNGEEDVDVDIRFQKHAPSSKGWMDRILVNAKRELRMTGGQLDFRDTSTVAPGTVTEFRFRGSQDVDRIWDVSSQAEVRSIPFDRVNGSPRFKVRTDSLREFIAFDEDGAMEPQFHGKVPNQNLHDASQPDMVIVTGSAYHSMAEDLASFHRKDGMDVLVATAREVYNEFSGGIRDITGIKDLMRMFYVRAGSDTSLMPDHLLLFGDGSFNNKLPGMDSHLLPTFQSGNSVSPTASYTSDDYFGLLDPSEGAGSSQLVDIGIGRLPVSDQGQARDVVNKIKNYANGSSMQAGGDCEGCQVEGASLQDPNWRDQILLVADDEDNNLHAGHAENIADEVRQRYPVMNQEKLYIDAFQQEQSAGGERYPEVNQRIDERVERGAMIVNYVGHGGERGWAQERILRQQMINEWENPENLPLFVTATCEFTRFDDHTLTSAGENVLLNPEGGGMGLLSTTRLVFASANNALNMELYQHLLNEENGQTLRLGEVVRRTKVGEAGRNSRKFLYFGDPALRLDVPEQRISVDSIDSSPVGAPMDTIRALSEVTVSGSVERSNGSIDNDFQGVVHPLVMDKQRTIETLANDGGNPFTFDSFNSTLHRGKASVENGKFNFSFVVPKDIAYQFGTGRISLLAEGDANDAHGYTENFYIGGTDPNADNDGRGPKIDIFMNDKDFVPGGSTDEDPLLLAELRDQSGINISSSGVGHDIKALLDGDQSDAVVLNQHYRSDLDTYKEGEVKYRYEDLEEGEHELTLKAWDVHNNPSERTVDFVVSESGELALDHILNYPNPFTTHTEFFFEHNQACNFLDVRIRIFTVSGKVVKTLDKRVRSKGFRTEGIAWDGTDKFGDPLAKGVYIYELNVRTPDGKKANEFEKLVLLK